MRIAAAGFLFGFIAVCVLCTRGGGLDVNPSEQKPGVLTLERTEVRFPLSAATIKQAPPVLALTFTKVVNPGQVGLGISVYLSYLSGSSSANEREKILIGNVSLYPPDHPAGFLLRSSGAFRQLQEAGAASKRVELLVEIKPIHAPTSKTPLELVVAPPEWRQEERR